MTQSTALRFLRHTTSVQLHPLECVAAFACAMCARGRAPCFLAHLLLVTACASLAAADGNMRSVALTMKNVVVTGTQHARTQASSLIRGRLA